MRRLSGRERAIIWLGGAAAVAFVYLSLLLLPVRRTAAALADERVQLAEKIAQADAMYQAAETAGGEVAALEQQLGGVLFPADDVRSGLVRGIEQLAFELGLTITSIRPEEPQQVEGALRHPAVIRLEADLAQIVRLLYELEQPERRLWVEGVEITTDRRAGERLQATIYVVAYSRERGDEDADAKA